MIPNFDVQRFVSRTRMPLLVAVCSLAIVCLALDPIVAQDSEQIVVEGESSKKVVITPWESVDVGSTAHFRGLHVVDDNVIWASGSGGTVIVSADGGQTWRQRNVAGASELDFRDVHGFDDGAAVVISSGDVAKVFRTTNGGRTWKSCGHKTGAFFDSIAFWDDSYGVLMSDPIGGRFWLARTQNGGRTWKAIKDELLPKAAEGEAGFAASGTNTFTIGRDTCFIGLGGAAENQSDSSSRILISTDRGKTWRFGGPVPLERSPSAGIFSLWFADESRGVAVGGDYKHPDNTQSNYAVTEDGGRTWTTPAIRVPPSGFRSCVAPWKKGREIKLVAVGTNGTDLSTDLGNKCARISNKGFHSVSFSETGRSGWAVGKEGSVARWVLPK